MSQPDPSEGFLFRMACLWDGWPARGWGERVAFWLVLLVLLGPMPLLAALGGWILFGFWGAVAAAAFGCLMVAGLLSRVTGNALETGCFAFILYVLLVLLVLSAWRVRAAADRIRKERAPVSDQL